MVLSRIYYHRKASKYHLYNHRIDFDAIITSLSMTNSVGEVLSADVSFDIDGNAHGNKF